MRYNGCKFHIKKLNEKINTSDCGIIIVFQVTNVSSRSDTHPKVSQNWYYWYLDDILECDFDSFKLVMFDVKWYSLPMNEHGTNKSIIQHDNGFKTANTSSFEPGSYRYALPSQWE